VVFLVIVFAAFQLSVHDESFEASMASEEVSEGSSGSTCAAAERVAGHKRTSSLNFSMSSVVIKYDEVKQRSSVWPELSTCFSKLLPSKASSRAG
jgi:hypothetical protein